MASVQEKKPCAKCPKGVGVTTCDGCRQSFCLKHIIEHRQELATKMDDLGQEHDAFRRDLSDKSADHPLLQTINQWEEESIQKIRTTAETARTNLRQLFEQMKNNLNTSLVKITHELHTHRGLDDYTEIDLNRWLIELTDLRQFLEAPSTVQIVKSEDATAVIHLIGVRMKAPLSSTTLPQSLKPYRSKHEIFGETTKSITLSENGLVATKSTEHYTYGTIFGSNSYSTGVHEIHFRIENKDEDNFFFGIVTLSETMTSRIYRASSANGWWGFDLAVTNGENQERLGRKILQTGDNVKLALDCANKEIRFEHERTKKTLRCRINIGKCPFPWKLVIALSGQNDVLRILP